MTKLFATLIGIIFLATVKSEDETTENSYLKVKTSLGYVEGLLEKTCRQEKEYVGFKGIPYAEPPIGKLRFKDPVPRKPWEGVWNATYERYTCVQDNNSNYFQGPAGFGEDCLFLNVFTPNVKYLKNGSEPPKAVMLFIHPGAFMIGSGTEEVFAPDFLIEHDVVVVTFNYRLGALGFLSLQNEDVPGNAGLKDQNLVLRWVKENIESFGGDSSKITIFGQSAGSASVHYHILSKASEGLFSSAIMQSGTALASWAYSPPDLSLQKGHNLAKKVGCNFKDPKQLLECLQQAPAESIVGAQMNAITLGEMFSLRVIPFQPTIEPESPSAFLTANPFDLLNHGNFSKVPTIIGSTMDEALFLYPMIIKNDANGLLLTLIGMDLSRFAPYQFNLFPFTKPAILAHKEISKFYFDNKMVSRATMSQVLELLTDVMFTVPIQLTAKMHAEHSVPVYNYVFSYEGGYNVGKIAGEMPSEKGIAHGDDLGYLFYMSYIHGVCGANRNQNQPDDMVLSKMTQMWTDFAKTGNPTPNPSDIQWKKFTVTEQNYVDIKQTPVPSDSLKSANMLFWDELIHKLIQIVSPPSSSGAMDQLEMLEENYSKLLHSE